MKKLVITLSLVLALVIAATVSLPALAADPTTTISVTIPANIIDIDLGDLEDPIDLTGATPTVPGTSTPEDITGGTNAENGITLQVADLRSHASPIPVKGYMDDAVDTPLTNPTEVQGGEVLSWAELTDDQTLYTGTGPGTFTIAGVQFQQKIDYTDPAGTYSITVTFVTSVNPVP